MKYLLDTNVGVDDLTGRFPSDAIKIQSALPEDLCLGSIVVAELRYGADESRRAAPTIQRKGAWHLFREPPFLAPFPRTTFSLLETIPPFRAGLPRGLSRR